MSRKWFPYEINHLSRFGFKPEDFETGADKEIPVEYLTGKSIFRDKVFEVNRDVLIPRVESEQIIEIFTQEIDTKIFDKKTLSFADIGTGSGIIGICAAHELIKRDFKFIGFLSDISEKAIKVAIKNSILNFLGQKVELTLLDKSRKRLPKLKDGINNLNFLQGNLLDPYPKISGLDFLFANLPYIPSSRLFKLPASVKDYEPLSALDGGPDGLLYIREFLNQSKRFIKKGGVIILEVDDTHSNIRLVPDIYSVEVKKDFNNKNRFWLLRHK